MALQITSTLQLTLTTRTFLIKSNTQGFLFSMADSQQRITDTENVPIMRNYKLTDKKKSKIVFLLLIKLITLEIRSITFKL